MRILFSRLLGCNKLNCLKIIRSYASVRRKPFQVTICGAAGKVGQSLALMLKQSALIDRLVMQDTAHVDGIVTELNHIDTRCWAIPLSGEQQLQGSLEKADLVVVLASAPKMSNEPFSAMFNSNAGIVKTITEAFAYVCPNAFLIIATNPVNCLVPLACEVLRKCKVLNKNKVIGATNLNVIRASTMAAEELCLKPEDVFVPVVGGNSEVSIIPLLSQIRPKATLTGSQMVCITTRVQSAHQDVIKTKANNKSAHLACAFAIARLVLSVTKALQGSSNIIECAYRISSAHPATRYIATPVLFGKSGIEKDFGIPDDLTDYESCQIQNAVAAILDDVYKGAEYCGVEVPQPCDPCSPDQTTPCPPNWCEM